MKRINQWRFCNKKSVSNLTFRPKHKRCKINKNTLLLFFAIFFLNSAFARLKVTLSGYVKDASTGEPLVSAVVAISELNKKVVTNQGGFYSITLAKGTYRIAVSTIGYKTQSSVMKIDDDKTVDFQLTFDNFSLNEVVVSETKKKNVKSTEMGVTRLNIQTIEKIPAFMGEVDLVRAVQMMPGVTTVGEGAPGFNVRGGSVDQNLILFDDAQVFNSSHMLGFFSIFNPDVVKDVKLIKGGIPANYGGRLASVLDIRVKEGNPKQMQITGGIGTVFSRLSIESPIGNKGSFVVAGRRSYFDLFLKLSSDTTINSSIFNFTDFNFKANYNLNSQNKLYFSAYWGRDNLGFGNRFNTNWGNVALNVRWNQTFSPIFFSNISAVYSSYDYSLGPKSGSNQFTWTGAIANYGLKADYNWNLSKHEIHFGASGTFYQFNPGEINGSGNFNSFKLKTQQSLESGIYLEDEYNINAQLSLRYGIRLSTYQLIGPATLYQYKDNNGKRKTLTDSVQYGNGQIAANYFNPEPRISFRWSLQDMSSIKFGYHRMAQYIHMISSQLAAAPFDNYISSSKNVKPQIADQVSVGYFRNFFDDQIETSVECYYKWMQNAIGYVPDANTLLQPYMEGELLFGKARSYGAEFYVRKTKGKITGWVSYTLAKTEQQVNGINNDQYFPANYDRRHNLNAAVMWQISNAFSASLDFVYLSGVRANFPTSKYFYQGLLLADNYYNTRNNYKVPDYHRMDFSLTYEPIANKNRRYHTSWVFSAYNLYSRRNPYSVSFRPNADNPTNAEAVQLSIVGSIVPAVTFNFKY